VPVITTAMSQSSRLTDAGSETLTVTSTLSPMHEPLAAGVTLLTWALPKAVDADGGVGLVVLGVGEGLAGLGVGAEAGALVLLVEPNVVIHTFRA
jgi:hypothetical protein